MTKQAKSDSAKNYCKDCKYSRRAAFSRCDKRVLSPDANKYTSFSDCFDFIRMEDHNKDGKCPYYKPKLIVKIKNLFTNEPTK
jgi:hypothetical protein